MMEVLVLVYVLCEFVNKYRKFHIICIRNNNNSQTVGIKQKREKNGCSCRKNSQTPSFRLWIWKNERKQCFLLLIIINTAIHYCDECRDKRNLCGDQGRERGRAKPPSEQKHKIQTVNCSFDNFNKSKSEKNYPQKNTNWTEKIARNLGGINVFVCAQKKNVYVKRINAQYETETHKFHILKH